MNNSRRQAFLTISRNAFRLLFFVGALAVFCAQYLATAKSQTVAKPKSNDQKVDLTQPLTLSWRYESDQTLNLTPAVADGRVYLPLARGAIVSLMGVSGQLNWRSEIGGELSASPVADQNSIFVASETGADNNSQRQTGALRALGREGGVTLWIRDLPVALRGGLTLNNGKLFGAGPDGKLYAFDSKTGQTVWTYQHNAPFNSQPVVSGGRVFIGGEDGSALALNETNGGLVWQFRTDGAIRGPVVATDEVICFGSRDGYVYAVTASDGRLAWRKRTGAAVEAVARNGNALLVASLDNFVYKFSFKGARVWKRRLPGRIASQPLVMADAALFMPFSSSSGVVLELRGGRQVNLLPAGEEIAISAAPIASGEVVLLTTEHGLLAFAQPTEKPIAKIN